MLFRQTLILLFALNRLAFADNTCLLQVIAEAGKTTAPVGLEFPELEWQDLRKIEISLMNLVRAPAVMHNIDEFLLRLTDRQNFFSRQASDLYDENHSAEGRNTEAAERRFFYLNLRALVDANGMFEMMAIIQRQNPIFLTREMGPHLSKLSELVILKVKRHLTLLDSKNPVAETKVKTDKGLFPALEWKRVLKTKDFLAAFKPDVRERFRGQPEVTAKMIFSPLMQLIEGAKTEPFLVNDQLIVVVALVDILQSPLPHVFEIVGEKVEIKMPDLH
jgi:hypothetical protein